MGFMIGLYMVIDKNKHSSRGKSNLQMEQNQPHLSKRCVELNHIDFFIHIWGSEGTCHRQHATTMVPLNTHYIHQSVYTHWACRRNKQHSSVNLVGTFHINLISKRYINFLYWGLTLIILKAHDLASSIVKTDSETRTIWFNVSPRSCIPVDTSYSDSPSRICEAADGHFHLKRNTWQKKNR